MNIEETVSDLETNMKTPMMQRITKVVVAAFVGVVAERLTEKAFDTYIQKRSN